MENIAYNPFCRVLDALTKLDTEAIGAIIRGKDTTSIDLTTIIEIAEDCHKRALTLAGESNGGHKAMLEDSGAKLAGLPSITDILTEYQSLRRIRDDLIRSIALRTEEILNLQRTAGEQGVTEGIMQIDEVLTPPDALDRHIEPGEGTFLKEFEDRIAMLQIILLDMGIDSREENSVEITIGRMDENMVRKVSYASIFIPRLRKLVEICNEVGNRSFVWNTDNAESVVLFGRMTKKEKDALLDRSPEAGSALIMKKGWEDEMRSLLMNSAQEPWGIGLGIERLIENIRKKVRHVDTVFDKRIAELTVWRSENPNEWPKAKGGSLGQWLSLARRKLRDGEYTDAEAEALGALGVEQSEVTKTTEERIAELTVWRSENPNKWPKWGSSLGIWLAHARKKLRDGKWTEEEAQQLKAMGVKPARIMKSTEEWIAELAAWHEEHPDEYPKIEDPLGQWLSLARRKLRDGEYTDAEAEALGALGVEPAQVKSEITKTTEERIAELTVWRSENPNKWPKYDGSLGQWLARARRKLRNGEYTDAEAKTLRALGVKIADARMKKGMNNLSI